MLNEWSPSRAVVSNLASHEIFQTSVDEQRCAEFRQFLGVWVLCNLCINEHQFEIIMRKFVFFKLQQPKRIRTENQGSPQKLVEDSSRSGGKSQETNLNKKARNILAVCPRFR